jgi:hypothetical protein
MKVSEPRYGQDIITVKLLRIHGFLASSDRAGLIATPLLAQLCTEIAKRKDRSAQQTSAGIGLQRDVDPATDVLQRARR